MRELAALVAATAGLLTAPYLAGLTLSAADRDQRTWWRPRRPNPGRVGVTAVAAVILAGLSGAAAGWTAEWPAFLELGLLGAVLVVVDAERHRLPDRITGTAAGAGLVLFSVAAAVDQTWARLGRVALAAAVVFAIFYLMALLSPRGVGLGDVKLAALLAGYLAWLSWLAVLAGLAGGFLAAGVTSIVLLALGRATRNTHVPLGPFLIPVALLIASVNP